MAYPEILEKFHKVVSALEGNLGEMKLRKVQNDLEFFDHIESQAPHFALLFHHYPDHYFYNLKVRFENQKERLPCKNYI